MLPMQEVPHPQNDARIADMHGEQLLAVLVHEVAEQSGVGACQDHNTCRALNEPALEDLGGRKLLAGRHQEAPPSVDA